MNELLFPAAIAIGAAAWALWNYLPVGEVHGQTVRLKDWRKNRIALSVTDAKADLNKLGDLPAAERLPALLALHEKHADVYIVGDEIRNKIVATGQDAALPWVDKFIEFGGRSFIASAARKACTSGDAQPHYRTQMFKKLQPYLDHEEERITSVGREKVPGALLALDRDWATTLLTGKEYFNPRHPLFPAILNALLEDDVAIPPLPADIDWSQAGHKEGELRLLAARVVARTDPAEAARQMRQLIDSNLHIRVIAGMELCALRGLPDPHDIGSETYRGGPGLLNRRERSIQVASCAHYASRNGDLVRLLDEEEFAGISLQDIAAAFRETGAPGHARWIESFGELMGPIATERDLSVRAAQVKTWSEDFREKVIDLGENGFPEERGPYEEENLFLYHYMLEHEADFEIEK